MARWKLMAPHYLHTDGCEWEYQEVDRKTGKNARRRFPVPQFLDPRDSADWTNKWGSKGDEEGEIIVCHAGKGEPHDIAFYATKDATSPGDPTPDMIPMDDEAKSISAGFATQWSYKPDTDDSSTFSQSLVDKFQMEMAEKETAPIQIAGLDAMMAQMAASQTMIAEAIKLMASSSVRRP